MKKLYLVYALVRLLLPSGVVRLLYGGRLAQADGRVIDPKAQAATDLAGALRDPDKAPDLAESRKQITTLSKKFGTPTPKNVRCENISLPGGDGPCTARVYSPGGVALSQDMPTLLYFHGGGWVQGSIESHDGVCGNLAALSGVRVISYDYRLAPEHRFPAPLEDVRACFVALMAGEGPVIIDPARLAVGGDSAGANLTAAMLHDLIGSGGPLPAAQLLIYPAVDGEFKSRSVEVLKDQPLLSKMRMEWFLDLYLPEGQDRADPRVSPINSDRLDGQPKAMIIAAGHDPLWDDGLSYAEALKGAGVEVVLEEYPGQVHGFVSLNKVIPEGADALSKAASWLKQTI